MQHSTEGRIQKAPRKSKQEWDDHWPRIKDLRDRNIDVPLIAAQMELVHGFEASPRQYKEQFKRRGLRKNLREEELRKICAYDLGRQQQGRKSSRYRARKRIVQPRDLKRHINKCGEPEPCFEKPSISYFECTTSQYDLDNPHVKELIQSPPTPYLGFDGSSEYTGNNISGDVFDDLPLADLTATNPGACFEGITPGVAQWDSGTEHDSAAGDAGLGFFLPGIAPSEPILTAQPEQLADVERGGTMGDLNPVGDTHMDVRAATEDVLDGTNRYWARW